MTALFPSHRLMFTALLAAAVVCAGCWWQSEHAATDARLRTPATSPASTVTQPAEAAASQPASSRWRQTAKGVELQIPAGWQPRKNPDFELMLVPRLQSGDEAQITFDIPDLPPHLPWMIQMTRIEHDYLADLKKKHPDLKRQDAGNASVSSATARLIRSVWHEDGKPYDDVALLMIHANAVYILDVQTDDAHLPAARQAFDQIKASLRWTK